MLWVCDALLIRRKTIGLTAGFVLFAGCVSDVDLEPSAPTPGAERCDGVDTITFYPDQDGDDVGTAAGAISACTRPDGYAYRMGDCDDNDPSWYPGALETSDGRDTNCDGTATHDVPVDLGGTFAFTSPLFGQVVLDIPAGSIDPDSLPPDRDAPADTVSLSLSRSTLNDDPDVYATNWAQQALLGPWLELNPSLRFIGTPARGHFSFDASFTEAQPEAGCDWVGVWQMDERTGAAMGAEAPKVTCELSAGEITVDLSHFSTWQVRGHGPELVFGPEYLPEDGTGENAMVHAETYEWVTRAWLYELAGQTVSDQAGAMGTYVYFHQGGNTSLASGPELTWDPVAQTYQLFLQPVFKGSGSAQLEVLVYAASSRSTVSSADQMCPAQQLARCTLTAISESGGLPVDCPAACSTSVCYSFDGDEKPDPYECLWMEVRPDPDPQDDDHDGYTEQKGDCDDHDASIHPGAETSCNGIDENCDGAVDNDVDADGDGFLACDGAVVDCDDQDPSTYPGAPESCDGMDEDCDGQVDEGVKLTFYLDADGDGYGSPAVTQACSKPDGYTILGGDCDDNDPATCPGTAELCDGLDNDCDGQVDEGFDKDGDGYVSCSVNSDPVDCNDQAFGINPGATEQCDAIDNNCDGRIDEGFDLDGDQYTSCGGDCDDSNAAVHPGVQETCNDVDENCNGTIDEGFDADSDGYTICSGDCNDEDPAVRPGRTEICNDIDDNCSGQTDEGFDQDQDGYTSCGGDCDDSSATINPSATETCNGVDDDCDARVDEGFDADQDGYTTCNGDCDDANKTIYPSAYDIVGDRVDSNCDGLVDWMKQVAGVGVFNGDGLPAGLAYLNLPSGVAVDDMSGNLYISVTNDNRIRKIDVNGMIYTVAGDGSFGYSGDGGPATIAKLNSPSGIALDISGNLYIADTSNNRIRKVDPKGDISTVAGDGTADFGGDGGLATDAMLNRPESVALDSIGNLFIADSYNGRIRKVGIDGSITTIAGSDCNCGWDNPQGVPATTLEFSHPAGLVVDPQGAVFFADSDYGEVFRIDSSGLLYLVLRLDTNRLSGITQDVEGKLHVADATNNIIQRIDIDGVVTAVAGTGVAGYAGDNGPATLASLNVPRAIAANRNGDLFIADEQNFRIRRVTNGYAYTAAGNGTPDYYNGDQIQATDALLSTALGVTADSIGNLYIADVWNSRIRRVAPDGLISTFAGSGASGDGGPATEAGLYAPFDVAADDDGNVFIADPYGDGIRQVDKNGIITTFAGSHGPPLMEDGQVATSGKLYWPAGVGVDPNGILYIAETCNHRIVKVGEDGIIRTVAGSRSQGYWGDGGPATDAALNYPYDVAADSMGNVYIADSYNNRIRVVGLDGIIRTFAGNGDEGYQGDGGLATEAMLDWPTRIEVDREGNVFIADTYNSCIRKVSVSGIISTVAGNYPSGSSLSETYATNGMLYQPMGIALNQEGHLFVADSENRRVMEIYP